MRVLMLAAGVVLAAAGSGFAQAPAETSVQRPGAAVPPSVIREVKPQYPEAALVGGHSGTVTLECEVNADGSVGTVRVLTPLEPSLDAEAVRALKQWLFKPGTKDGKAVPVAVTVEMTFTSKPKGPKLDSSEVFKPGGNVVAPRLVKDVKPAYTPDAMRARVQGKVELEYVVLPDGTVGDARVRAPLHPQLDAEALKALRQWQFTPGLKDGVPVAVQLTAEMSFTMK